MLLNPMLLKAIKDDTFYFKIMTSQLKTIALQLGINIQDIRTGNQKKQLRKRIIKFLEKNNG